MALSPGDIYFTASFTDTDIGAGNFQETFSFISTSTIPSTEPITFYDNSNSFTYTPPAGGLPPYTRVTIAEDSNVFTILAGPAGGTISGVTGSWSLIGSSTVIAGSGGHAIAAIAPESADTYANALANSGLNDTALQAAPAPSPLFLDFAASSDVGDNVMFVGPDIADYNDPTKWTTTGNPVDHSNPTIGTTTYASQDSNLFCFAEGTLISCPDGDKRVENLQIGDPVLTSSGKVVRAKWIGRQTVSTRFGPAERLMPVRILAGALGDGLPLRDLVLTSDHALLVDGLLITAGALVNGTSIAWVPLDEFGDSFTVYHLETEDHDILLAEGTPAETFIDYVGRQAFDNYAEYVALYGDDRTIDEMAYPRISAARLVPAAIRDRLSIKHALVDVA